MSVFELAMKHVSTRVFLQRDIDEGDLTRILEVARRAPSAWNMQSYHVIAVRDQSVKSKLAAILGGQDHVASAPVLLVFALDQGKILEAARRLGLSVEPGPSLLLEASINIGIAAGWAALAAEELGYGVVFIALYRDPCRVAEAMGIHGLTPLLGLALGKPGEKPRLRPRQMPAAVYSVSGVTPVDERVRGLLDVYGSKAASRLGFILGEFHREASASLVKCLGEQWFKTSGELDAA